MIFALIALLALAVLAPLLLVLRSRAPTRGARELALDLHRTQLRELDRDIAEGRILPDEHKTAVLEVQRRILSVAGKEEAAAHTGARWPILVTAIVVPLMAAGLYAVSGSRPLLPSVQSTAPEAQFAEQAALIAELRERLAQMDPASDRARQGYLLLGQVEESRGNDTGAASAYRLALRGRFDASIAARAAEASVRAEGGVTESTAALFRRAIAAAPDAPWRPLAERRLQQPRLP